MKINKILLIFVSLIFIAMLMSNVSAFFYWSHEKFVIQGFNDVSSTTTTNCRPYLSVVIDGDLASDSGVLYYSDSNDLNRKSYIFPHTIQGYKSCMLKAGSDVPSQCYCIGNYLHIIQDAYSHGTPTIHGVTQDTLATFFGNNYFGHMTVERNFQLVHMDEIKSSNPTLYAQVQDADTKVLNNMLITDSTGKLTPGGKYMDLLNSEAGIDMRTSLDTIRRGYLNLGFYDAVYKDKISLPLYPYIIIPSIMIILGLLIGIMLLIYGKTNWRWFGLFLSLIVVIIGILVFFSFNPPIPFTNTNIQDIIPLKISSWQVINLIIEIPPKFGYLAVSKDTVSSYDAQIQKATDDFLKDPSITPIEDASGLTYKDSSGVMHNGTLSQAETGYKYFLFPLLSLIIVIFVIVIILKSFGIKLGNKFLNGLMNIYANIGMVVFFILLGMITYGILTP